MGITALLFFIAAEPCVSPVDLLPPLVAPADGAVGVPMNARIVVDGGGTDIVVSGPAGAVAVTSERLSVSSPTTVLTPTTRLPAGATITVSVGGTSVGSFVVADVVDTTAPAAPDVEVRGRWDGGSCSPLLELGAQTAQPDTTFAFFLARVGGLRSADAEAPEYAGMAIDDVLVVRGESNVTAAIAVVAVDLAGNISAPTTVTATFPEGSDGFRALGCFGCTATGDGAPFIAFGLALLRARRRRR